jgi:hypothetical protein
MPLTPFGSLGTVLAAAGVASALDVETSVLAEELPAPRENPPLVETVDSVANAVVPTKPTVKSSAKFKNDSAEMRELRKRASIRGV